MSDLELEKARVAELLYEHDKPSLVFKELFQLHKLKNSNFSIGFICRECEIPSRGYISEFLNGKRRLNQKYWKVLIDCFGLKGRFADIAHVLLEIEEAGDDEDAKVNLERRLHSLRRAIRNDAGSFPRKLHGLFFAFEVFCAFGLFKNEPSKQDLRSYFGREFALEVEYALTALLSLDLIASRPDREHFYLKEHAIRFNNSEDDGMSHLNYLRYAIKDAEEKIKNWYRKEDAIFESSIISVRKADYQQFLKKYFEEYLIHTRDLESSDADTLVRFNVQIYPVR